jgi:hypothetical protein
MKHLKKFNENNLRKIDAVYISHCFADLIDENKAAFRNILSNSVVIHVNYNNDDIEFTEKNNLLDYDNINWRNDRIKPTRDIEIAIYRLLDEYPKYEIDVIPLQDKRTTHYRIEIILDKNV